MEHVSGSVFELFLQRSETAVNGYERHVALFSHLHE